MQFEALSETLLRGGIAPWHVRRYLIELSEHLHDLTTEQYTQGYNLDDAAIRARIRLGSDAELANAMLAHKQFRSWVARAPIAVFFLLPPAVTVAAAFATLTPLVVCARLTGLFGPGGIDAQNWFRIMVTIVVAFGNFVLAPALALGFVWIGRRQRIRDFWPLLAVSMIVLLDLQFQARFPALGHRGGEVGIGAGMWLFHFRNLMETWRLATLQAFLTLLPAFWLLHRKTVNR
jgi:hypothetical protein